MLFNSFLSFSLQPCLLLKVLYIKVVSPCKSSPQNKEGTGQMFLISFPQGYNTAEWMKLILNIFRLFEKRKLRENKRKRNGGGLGWQWSFLWWFWPWVQMPFQAWRVKCCWEACENRRWPLLSCFGPVRRVDGHSRFCGCHKVNSRLRDGDSEVMWNEWITLIDVSLTLSQQIIKFSDRQTDRHLDR